MRFVRVRRAAKGVRLNLPVRCIIRLRSASYTATSVINRGNYDLRTEWKCDEEVTECGD